MLYLPLKNKGIFKVHVFSNKICNTIFEYSKNFIKDEADSQMVYKYNIISTQCLKTHEGDALRLLNYLCVHVIVYECVHVRNITCVLHMFSVIICMYFFQ
jgi:hypothetical protein